jgi:hypothetical protein
MAVRRTFALLLAAGGVLALAWWLADGERAGAGAPAAPASAPAPAIALGAPGEHRRRRADGAPGIPSALRLTPALARAYAAAGALLDGRRHDLAGLDPATVAELGHAEELLAYATAQGGQRLATRLPGGATLQIADGASAAGAGAAPAAGPGASTGARARRGDASASAAPASVLAAGAGAGATALPPAAVASSLAGGDRQPIPISGETTKLLTLPDAWLAIPYQPAQVQGQPLVIENRSSGEYAISLLGGDFGEVRLDGGLVVPGRYYRINGAATITSTVPVGVHIRPLTAVGTYYDQPLIVPSADG